MLRNTNSLTSFILWWCIFERRRWDHNTQHKVWFQLQLSNTNCFSWSKWECWISGLQKIIKLISVRSLSRSSHRSVLLWIFVWLQLSNTNCFHHSKIPLHGRGHQIRLIIRTFKTLAIEISPVFAEFCSMRHHRRVERWWRVLCEMI